MLVAKAVRKGRTQAEVDEIIGWLTGYSAPQIEAAVQNGTLYGDFFFEMLRSSIRTECS